MKELILLLLLLLTIPVSANEKCPCPDEFLAKYECEQGHWTFTEGQDIIALTGNCQEVNWASDVEISCVMGKAGQDCAQYAGGYSGIIMAGEHDLSHLNFCKEKATLVSLIHFGGHQENQSEEDMVPIITISWIFFTMLFILIELIRRRTK